MQFNQQEKYFINVSINTVSKTIEKRFFEIGCSRTKVKDTL